MPLGEVGRDGWLSMETVIHRILKYTNKCEAKQGGLTAMHKLEKKNSSEVVISKMEKGREN